MRTYLHSGLIIIALVGSAVQAAAQAQVAPDEVIERPDRNLPGAVAPASDLRLTAEQKVAIFQAVQAVKDAGSKTAPTGRVQATVGAQVTPTLELYVLPEPALAVVPEAKGVKYTLVKNQVVLVDPTTMRVVEVISQ